MDMVIRILIFNNQKTKYLAGDPRLLNATSSTHFSCLYELLHVYIPILNLPPVGWVSLYINAWYNFLDLTGQIAIINDIFSGSYRFYVILYGTFI